MKAARLSVALLIVTGFLASISPNSGASSNPIIDRQSTAAERPVIRGIQLDGKRLIVTGEGCTSVRMQIRFDEPGPFDRDMLVVIE